MKIERRDSKTGIRRIVSWYRFECGPNERVPFLISQKSKQRAVGAIGIHRTQLSSSKRSEDALHFSKDTKLDGKEMAEADDDPIDNRVEVIRV